MNENRGSMVLGTTLGREKPNGDVYYINMPSMTLDDIFDQGLFHGWNHIGDYTECAVKEYFSRERFDLDKTYWRVLFLLDGSVQIREDNSVSGASKDEVCKPSPIEKPMEPITIPTINLDDAPSHKITMSQPTIQPDVAPLPTMVEVVHPRRNCFCR